MKKVIASAGLLALGAVGVHDARADWSAGADKPWSISGTLRGFYDSNINTQPDGSGRESSFGFEASPSVHLNYSDGPTVFTASYAYGLFYYDNRHPNHLDQTHDLELFMNHSFSERYSLDVEESFIDSQEPEVLAPQGGGLLRANGDNFRNVFGFHFTDQFTELFGLVVGYQNTFYDYTGNLPNQSPGQPSYGDLLNRFEHLIVVNGRYTVDDQTTAVLGYNFGLVQYYGSGSIAQSQDGFVSPDVRNDYSHYIYVGLDHNFRSDLSVSLRGGAQITEYYNAFPGTPSSQVTPYASASLNYTYMDGGVLSVGFTHALNSTDVSFDPVTHSLTLDQESSTVSASVIQTLTPISPNLQASATFQYQNSDFNADPSGNIADNFYLFGFNLTYQITHYISCETGYNYDLLSSDVPGRGYNRNRVYIGVTATY